MDTQDDVNSDNVKQFIIILLLCSHANTGYIMGENV